MAIYALFVFNRHCECIYHTSWRRGTVGNSTGGGSAAASAAATAGQNSLDAEATGDPDLAAAVAEDAKLVYGVVFSLRNMVSKLAPRKDAEGFQSYRAGAYRLHFFETPSGMRLVMTTDPASE
ncbi:TRAPP subunit bet5, partial [Cladochytrium tenue]